MAETKTTEKKKIEAPIYDRVGKETGKMDLPADVFGVKWNADMVHQVVTSMLSDSRQNVADTKDRGEIRGGGKKPWRQKGTGRSRHGSSRSPIWKGGGVTHGPTSETNYSRKVNKKMKTKALYAILSAKLKDNEIILVDGFDVTAPKAKDAQKMLTSLAKHFEKIDFKRGKRAIVAMPAVDEKVRKSFANIKSVQVEETRNINPVSLVNFKYLVMINPAESLKGLANRAK